MSKVKVGIIGAGGYGGVGAIELLGMHPDVELAALMDIQDLGKPVSELHPHLQGFCDLPLLAVDDPEVPDDLDIVLFSTPDRVGQMSAAAWLAKGVKVIDYSGDFRFNSPDIYAGYATRINKPSEHNAPELLSQSVYGLAELHREEIRQAKLVGNPGCFAVSCILGLAPAMRDRVVQTSGLICDAKTGVSGGGKNPKASSHYPARYEAMNAYRVSGHQHVFEVEHELGLQANSEIILTFTPHAVPMTRGIMSTLYADLKPGQNLDTALEAYRNFYADEKFVRVFGPDRPQTTTNVRGSNYCNLSINVDKRTNKLIVVSYIDNLLKGQAGNAVQNLNLMMGLDEWAGLQRPGLYP